MMSGAVFGYRGLVREILAAPHRGEFSAEETALVATGGYAQLIARKLPEIEAVHPDLTLEGLRIVANRNLVDSRAWRPIQCAHGLALAPEQPNGCGCNKKHIFAEKTAKFACQYGPA